MGPIGSNDFFVARPVVFGGVIVSLVAGCAVNNGLIKLTTKPLRGWIHYEISKGTGTDRTKSEFKGKKIPSGS